MSARPEAIEGSGVWGPRRVDAYLFAGFTLAALIASMSLLVRETNPSRALWLAAAPAFLFGVLSVAARYPSRSMPLHTSRWTLLAGVHLAGATAAGLLWAFSWRSWARLLARFDGGPPMSIDLAGPFGTGFLLYLIAVIAQYLLLEMESAEAARRAALRAALAAREAELRAFKAQVDPHFLFNSLNAIASLCGTRPGDARVMAQRLADFFRLTVRFGKRDRITVADEIDLARKYLEIEQTRFGPRLAAEVHVAEEAGACGVPPLLLQPLVENAVRHGIANLVDGGTIRIEAAAEEGMLRIAVTNPVDADRPHGGGEGVGLANVRGRLAAAPDEASLTTREAEGMFEAVIRMRAEPLQRGEE